MATDRIARSAVLLSYWSGVWQSAVRLSASFTALCAGFAPSVKARPADPEIAARGGNLPDLRGISKYPQSALNLALILG